jgi:hypothetical protein
MIQAVRRWKKNRARSKRRAEARRFLSASPAGLALPLVKAVADWTIARLLNGYTPTAPLPTVVSFQLKSTRRPWGSGLTIRALLRR